MRIRGRSPLATARVTAGRRLQQRLDPPVDAIGAQLGDRRPCAVREARPQLRRAEQPLERVAEGLRRARRHEQPVDAVDDDLADPADGRRDERRADGERLDRRVREVLPVAGEDRRLRAGQGLQHLVARQRADEANAAVQAGSARVLLEPGAVGAVADDGQLGVRHVRERVEGDVHRLLARQPAGEDEAAPLGLVAARAGGAGFGTTCRRSCSSPQPRAISAR